MRQRKLEFRVWDPIRKEIAPVYELILNSIQIINHFAIKAKFKDGINLANPNSIVLQNLGITDMNNNAVFEQDLLEILFYTKFGANKIIGRAIWNETTAYGNIGPAIIDEHGSILQFSSFDSFVVVGNSFQGIIK